MASVSVDRLLASITQAPAFVRLVCEADLQGFQEEIRNHPRLDVKAGLEFHDRTPLHFAALLGRVEVVEFILDHQRSLLPFDVRHAQEVVNAKDRFGYTPLHLAVRSQQEEVVRILTASSWVLPDRFIAATSDVDEDTEECEGYTPLHWAAAKGHVPIVKLLLRQSLCRGDYNAYEPVNINATTWNGLSALDIAKSNHHVKLVDLLECSDLSWLQAERDKNASVMNAVLVGAALIVAATFATWLQPPLGIPTYPIPDPVPAKLKVQSDVLAIFLVFVAMSFALALATLIIGTVSIIPFHGDSLKSEVEYLRSAVERAAWFLMMAVFSFNNAFLIACFLVFEKVAYVIDVISTVGEVTVTVISVTCNVYMLYVVKAFKQRKKGQYYGKKTPNNVTRSVILYVVVEIALLGVLAIVWHVIH